MDNAELKQAIETLLFITDHPLPMTKLASLTGEKDQEKIAAAIAELKQDYENRGVQVLEIAEGVQMGTRPGFANVIRKLYSEKMTMRLSTAALETLSIVGYKQPLTRAEIEEIRGVEVIAALESLLDKRLIKVVGRRESVGRPLLYGTTPEFMRHFGLKNLEDLPPIDSFTIPETPAAGTEPGAVASLDGAPAEGSSSEGSMSSETEGAVAVAEPETAVVAEAVAETAAEAVAENTSEAAAEIVSETSAEVVAEESASDDSQNEA